MNRIQEIRDILTEFVEYDKGQSLREELKEIADKTYEQKYSSEEQVNFLSRHSASIRVVHSQDNNHPYYLEMFCVLTQHIHADNIAQLLDKGIDIEIGNY